MHRVHLTFLVAGSEESAWKVSEDLEARFSGLEGRSAVAAWVEPGRPPAEGRRSAESFKPRRGVATAVGGLSIQRPV